MAIDAAAPSPSFLLQRDSIFDSALAQALPGKETDRDLGLVEPTAVLGGVVRRKPIPQPAPGLLAKAFHHRLAGMRTQIVQHQMNGVRLRVADRNFQQVVGELGRRPMGRHLGEVLPRFRFDSAEHVGGAATQVFAIAPRDSSRLHGQRRTNLLVEHHRFLVHTNHRFPLTQRLFVHGQDVLHAPDIFLIQFRHAPHFFPATASGRGFRARPGWFPVPPAAPVCVSPLLRSADAPSSVSGLPAVDHTPAPRSVADAARPARPFSPVVAARTRPAPSHLADSVGWSAIRSSGLTPLSSPLGGWVAPPPVAAGPKPAAPSARAANHSATSAATRVVPVWIAEPKIAHSCPSYKLGLGFRQVSTCITIYAVVVLAPRAVVHGCAPSDTHPARLAGAPAALRAAPRPVATIRESAPPCPEFVDVECRSSTAECPVASATATTASAQTARGCSTKACRDPSTSLPEHRSIGRFPPVAAAPVGHVCRPMQSARSGSDCDRPAPTADPPVAAIPSAL